MVLVSTLNPWGSVCQANLYGVLERNGNSWSFSKIQTSQPSSSSVNLHTKAPLSYDMSSYYCKKVLWGTPIECNESEEKFRDSSTSIIATTFVNLFGIGFFGLGLLANGFVLSKNSHFAQDDFDSAVSSAFKIGNVDELVSEYDSYITYVNNKKKQYEENAEPRLKNIFEKHQKQQQRNLNELETSYVVNDLTGLWSSATQLPQIYPVPTTLDVIQPILEANTNFSATPEQFLKELKASRSDLDLLYSNKLSSLNGLLANYDKKLSEQSKIIELKHAHEMSVKDFYVKCDYPEIVDIEKNKNVTVKYTIQSKSWDNVFPKYENKDENLTISFDGETIKFVNTTNKYLQIKSVSVYYNAEVYNIENGLYLELPPNTWKDYNPYELLGANNIKKEAKYININKQNALNNNFTFGFAVKYRSVEQSVDKTIYKTNKYNLYKVLAELVNKN